MSSSNLMTPPSDIPNAVVEQFSKAMYQWTGVWTDPGKTYLLRQRLQPILQDHGIGCYEDLLTAALRDRTIQTEIVDALTTHETLFFRDRGSLDLVVDHLIPGANLSASPTGNFDIWMGGCSSGQEPYSLAILADQKLAGSIQQRVRITATDVSPKVIDRAKAGKYDAHEVRRGISDAHRSQYFQAIGDGLEIVPEIRKRVRFEVASLMRPTEPNGPFDVIFCRNVLIYFQQSDVQRIVDSLMNRLKPDGCVIVGSSEILPASPRYRRTHVQGVSVYVRN